MAFVRDALEARDHGHPLFGEYPLQQRAVDPVDERGGMRRRRADRDLPAHVAARLHAHPLQRDRQQPAGDLLAAGNDHVIFARVVERGGFAAKLHQPVGLAGHCRDDHRHVIAALHLALDEIGDVADALDARHRRAAKLHHDAGHGTVPPKNL